VYTLTGTFNDECPFELNVILENENSADNANGSYDIEWTNGATSAVASNLAYDHHFVTVTDAANCKAIAQGYIGITYQMYSNQTVLGSLCNNNTGEVDLNLSGGAGSEVFTCQWMDGNTSETR